MGNKNEKPIILLCILFISLSISNYIKINAEMMSKLHWCYCMFSSLFASFFYISFYQKKYKEPCKKIWGTDIPLIISIGILIVIKKKMPKAMSKPMPSLPHHLSISSCRWNIGQYHLFIYFQTDKKRNG